jgi:hypothetical protein
MGKELRKFGRRLEIIKSVPAKYWKIAIACGFK